MIKKFARLFFALSLILALSSCAPVTIDTVPTGAEVYSADGQTLLGTTPFDTSVVVGDKNFIVRKEHYFEEPVTLNYDSERHVIMKFRPAPVLVYSKPLAEIYPSGSETPMGSTPMKVNVSDKAGTYTLKAEDYYDQEITVGPGSPDPIVVELIRRPIVTLSAEPEGVEIYENGQRIGTAPLREEILSPRTFEMRKANYFTQTGTVTGAPPYEVNVVLKPFPVITVAAAPAGAQILRAGKLIGKDSVKLPIGEQTVLEVRANRYYPQRVTLTPASSAQVNVALQAMPYVMINSEPSGAEVVINGRPVGTTPVEQLIEKETVVELRKEGFVTKTATLTGADRRVTVTLEAVPPPVAVPEEPAVVQPAEKTTAAAVAEEPAAEEQPIQQETAQTPPASPKLLPWMAGITVTAAAAAGLLLAKRKKK
jgi:hypothetical protein